MVIIFFDATENKLYICSEYDKTKVVNANDEHVLDYIPNDDILYVESAHYVTKEQFKDWISNKMQPVSKPSTDEVSKYSGFLRHDLHKKQQSAKPKQKEYFIHPTRPGTILIQDIKIPGTRHAEGIELSGKWDFLSIKDAGGQDVLDESIHFRTVLAQGKVEVVDNDYLEQHKHKIKGKNKGKTPTEASLDAILVPAHIKAEQAANEGGGSDDVAQTIYID